MTETLNDFPVRLKAVPVKAFLRLPAKQTFISVELPIGELCHEAAEAIEMLERLLENEHALRRAAAYPAREALAELVRLKDYKDQHGKDLHYEAAQKGA